jgi:hypothetical protein
MLDMKTPNNVPELRTALGLFNFYRKYLCNYSTICKPLTNLLKKDSKWTWSAVEKSAYADIKQALGSAPALFAPDFSRPFQVHTDWSNHGVGAVLVQLDDQLDPRPVMFSSRSCNSAESNYCSYEGELMAVVFALHSFCHYLWGRSFKLITDHQPLVWIWTAENLKGKLARWAMHLRQFDFEIVHRAGTDHADADALSRLPSLRSDEHVDLRLHGTSGHSAPAGSAIVGDNSPAIHSINVFGLTVADDPLLPHWGSTIEHHDVATLWVAALWGGRCPTVPSHTVLPRPTGRAGLKGNRIGDHERQVEDIWLDLPTLQYIKTAQYPPLPGRDEADRVDHRNRSGSRNFLSPPAGHRKAPH